MRCSITAMARSVCILAVVGLESAALAQSDPSIWMEFRQPANGVINPDGLVVIDTFVDGVVAPDLLRVYQNAFEIVPHAGATGGLIDPEYEEIPPELIPPDVPPPDPYHGIAFYPRWVDQRIEDWVFADATGGVIALGGFDNAYQLPNVGATLLNPADSTEVLSPKYLATYVLLATPDAVGNFDVNFVLLNSASLPATWLQDQNQLYLPFTATGITVSVVEAAAFDDCGDALFVGDGVRAFSTLNSSTDGPALPAGCDEGTGNGLSFEHDVWFEHVAGCTGTLKISTCNDADFDTRLAVYGTGVSTCTCPTDNTTFLACNDDAPGCASGTSKIALPVSEGECLTIRIGAAFGEEGTGDLTITCAPDICQSASPVTIGSTTVGSTEDTPLNDDFGVDCGTGLVDSPGVWYAVTGTGNLMTASLCNGSSYDTRLTVYQGGCAGLGCVADADDNCGGASQNESVSWCSTSGTQYLILVHGVGGSSGTFTLRVTDQSCNDINTCTRDSCVDTLGDLVNGVCSYVPDYEVGVECCNPLSGATEVIDDGNECTNDVCNASTGVVTHPPVPDETPCEDDGYRCTLDRCAAGVCDHPNINDLNLVCTSDANCPPESICCPADNPDCVAGRCYCEPHPTLALVPQPGMLPVAGCYSPGETIWVYVEMGLAETPVVGAQFFVEYDPTTLHLEGVDPGAVVDPDSPFTLEFNETVNHALGTIDYVIGVNFGSFAQEETTVAVIEFTALAECDAYLQFRASGPAGQPNTFVAPGGVGIGADLINPEPPILSIWGSAPTLTACPADRILGPDPGLLTAAVTWTPPQASDNCDVGSIPAICSPASGSAFQPGTTTVTCTASNSCGLSDFCTFDVTVEPPVVTVDVQLSPNMMVGPIQRCITFDLWDCDGPPAAQHVTVSRDVTFVSAQATGIDVPTPGGDWECITARDELHSLRSTAPDLSTTDGIQYTASFVGNRASGGHWLVGGNLNDDNYIDILDFGVFFPLFLSQAAPNTPCGTAPPDANVNGDFVVDLLDLVFISGNSLMASEPDCCGGGVATADSGPVTSISVRELRSMGLGHMAVADVNRDGVLDMNDLTAFMQGDVPPSGDDNALRERPREKPGRGIRGYNRPGR